MTGVKMGATTRWVRRVRGPLACLAFVLVVAAGCGGSAAPSSVTGPNAPISAGPWDWPTYGHDAQHTFHGRTTLTQTTAKRLKVAWYFPTADIVTATPTVVHGTVYVGSWDGYFYAVNLKTGALRWKYQLTAQDAITPYPGENPRDNTSDGGLVTSSAWYEEGNGTRPNLVIFGGGFTLYALNAETGALYWRHAYDGRPELGPMPDKDGTRIFSSPVVVGNDVIFGVDVDGQNGERGYIGAANLETGHPVWLFQTDANSADVPLNNGCGSVWSSGTVLPKLGLIVFDVADCDFSNVGGMADSVIALHSATGRLAWVYRPPLPSLQCDWDFGATANAGVDAQGAASFLGVGGKDGTYYSLDPATGHLRWSTNVVFGGFAGGFIATTAYDGQRVYGSTALGDSGRFEKDIQILCDPSNPRDTLTQEPTVHAFVASNGAIAWQADHAASFAPTTVGGGMTFNGPGLDGNVLMVRDAATGRLIDNAPVPGPIWSGIATVGDSLVTGIGSTYSAHPGGIAAITPGGARPVVPQ
jgi:polyvinyl alcohol dehydrogenase (cytochrome)